MRLLDNQQTKLLDHIRALVEEHKREISIAYSEMKLRLPSYLKTVTIQQLREAGATVDPNITIPKKAEEHLRKYVALKEKVREIEELFRTQVKHYYDNVKKDLPREMLKKRLEDLSDEEWSLLGVDIALIRRHYPADGQTN